jgi:hypothetical protein
MNIFSEPSFPNLVQEALSKIASMNFLPKIFFTLNLSTSQEQVIKP